MGQFLTYVLAQVGTVAPHTAVGAHSQIDGKGHLVGIFLKYDVVVVIFEHSSSNVQIMR